jgi:hypothetical protein
VRGSVGSLRASPCESIRPDVTGEGPLEAGDPSPDLCAQRTEIRLREDLLMGRPSSRRGQRGRDRCGRFSGVEENAPRPTDTITGEFGEMGAIAYRDLSCVAHGGLSGLIGRLDELASTDGSTLMGPAADASGRLPHLAASLTAYASASERRIRLFGWDPTKWRLPSLEVIREVFDEPTAERP